MGIWFRKNNLLKKKISQKVSFKLRIIGRLYYILYYYRTIILYIILLQDDLLLKSLLKSITKGLRHKLSKDFKKVEKRNTLVKIKLRNIKTTKFIIKQVNKYEIPQLSREQVYCLIMNCVNFKFQNFMYTFGYNYYYTLVYIMKRQQRKNVLDYQRKRHLLLSLDHRQNASNLRGFSDAMFNQQSL